MAPLEEGLQVLLLVSVPVASAPCSITSRVCICLFAILYILAIAHLFVIPRG
jgi:uncharacterized protein YhhL (DUF1145 family)